MSYLTKLKQSLTQKINNNLENILLGSFFTFAIGVPVCLAGTLLAMYEVIPPRFVEPIAYAYWATLIGGAPGLFFAAGRAVPPDVVRCLDG